MELVNQNERRTLASRKVRNNRMILITFANYVTRVQKKKLDYLTKYLKNYR